MANNNLPHSTRVLSTSGFVCFLKIIGGVLLSASFFLPAINKVDPKGVILGSFSPMSITKIPISVPETWLLGIFVPIFYIFGFTTALVVFYGRFIKRGVPTTLLSIHTIITLSFIISSGLALYIAMMIPEKSFGLTLIPFAILASLPLFILFIVPWFKRDRTFLKRLMSTTYICSLLNIILLSLVTLDALYSKLHGVEYGMYIALIGNALMLIASRSSKQERDD